MQTGCLTKEDYKGQPSTLCTGCGHDLLSNHIVNACLKSRIDPLDVVKVSGIGCSSKIPAYFMSKSFAVNSMHGRMAPVATGIKIVNQHMKILGISGDGDTASIGIGGFIHLVRRNLPMVYIIANNGVYGLTKGQFSPTADNTPYDSIDLCTLSLEMGCGFVARGSVGDAKQMIHLIEAAFQHPGTAVIDVISPCIAFNNHDASTKSYTHVKTHVSAIELNPYLNPIQAISAIKKTYKEGKILTGLFYQNADKENLTNILKLQDKPLSDLNENDVRPTALEFDLMMKQFQ